MAQRPLVYVLEPIAPGAIAILERCCDIVPPDDPRRSHWPDDADAVIVRTSRIDADGIAAARRLKVIGKHGVGVDNIDLDAARGRGIAVISTPGANANAVAELAVGLALAVARRIALQDRHLRQGGPLIRSELGFELTGRTIGVIGLGAVGRRTAALFRAAFGGPVLGYDPYAPEPAWIDAGIERCVEQETLLERADIVTVHAPLTPATTNMIDAAGLARMRPGAILLNLARGGVVDEAALYDALTAGRLGGAASDVFVAEPPAPDHPLLSLANFVATSHIGAATRESMDRMGDAVVAGVLAVLEGREPDHRVV
jgi:D-3-phosphoglycerate dehydrogenase